MPFASIYIACAALLGIGSFGAANVSAKKICPVPTAQLLSFEVFIQDNIVAVKWATSVEVDNEAFIIERSLDSHTYEAIGAVPGARASSNKKEYVFYDHTPEAGISYYRVKKKTANGFYSYSNIAAIEIRVLDAEWIDLEYPIVGKEDSAIVLQFSSFENTEILVVLLNMEGKEEYSKVKVVESGSNLVAVDQLGRLERGIYTVLASSKNQLYSKRIIVN